MRKRIIFSLISVGFTSMAAQIVLIRQLLTIFYGNELSVGISLASWLLGIALGSWFLAGLLIKKLKSSTGLFSLIQIILGLILFLSILGARFIPGMLRVSAGEIIGILPMSLATFVLFLPVCIPLGFLFVLGCQIYKGSLKGATKIGRVYILEAIGATIGGLITSLFLIRILSPLYIISLVVLLNLLSAFLLLLPKRLPAMAAGFLMLGFIFLLFSGKISLLSNFSLAKQWQGYELLTCENSIYGNIAVTKREDLYSVFINGLYDFSVPDELTSEMSAHFPLLQHPNPKEVLLVGGGLSGHLKEVLKHPVVRVDYVELDPRLIKTAQRYLPPNESLEDKRVRAVTNIDGRLFIKRTKYKYDVIIINLPEPYTAQLNRFYTQEFYREVGNVLKNKGVLSFSLSSNPNYIGREQGQLVMTLKNTLGKVFSEVIITPGNTNYFMASKDKNILSLDWQVLMDRLKKRGITAKYMREYYLYSELSKERIDFFADNLKQTKINTVNRDFRPIAYYYDMVLWSTFFKYNLKGLFMAVNAKRIYISFLLLSAFLLIPAGLARPRKKFSSWPILVCVATTGFAEISFQMVTLLSFQVLYGYLYYKLGVILTSFMLGLILGGWWITRLIDKGKGDYGLFIKTQAAIFIYPLILPVLFAIFSNLNSNFSFWVGSNIVFAFLPLIPGFIGGLQYPLANKLYLKKTDSDIISSASLTYGLDLFGSCLGAILVTVFLLPIIGIPLTCFLVAGLNLAGLILLIMNLGKR